MAKFQGNGKNDILRGTSGADTFYGYQGNHTGIDTFVGNGGQDEFFGGYGFNTVDYSWSPTGVNVNLSKNGDWQDVGIGVHLLNRLSNIQGLIGSNFNDHLVGHNNSDTLSGGGGDDRIEGDLGDDKLYGGAGNDTIQGSVGNDTITGDSGNDTLSGGSGDDTIGGGTENDLIHGDQGADTLNGDGGDDIIYGDDGSDVINGGAGNDKIYGGSGDNTLQGGAGNDLVVGGIHADKYYGGDGTDTASYENAYGVTVNLNDLSGLHNLGDAYRDTFSSIEILILSPYDDVFVAGADGANTYGGSGNDKLAGGAGKDFLYGDDGNDTLDGGIENDNLYGGGGNDRIIGGLGIDGLNGGTGNDTFVFTGLNQSSTVNPDHIYDFAKGDVVDISSIDANPGVAGDQAFVMKTAFTHHAGEAVLSYAAATGFSSLLLDANGDGVADFRLDINGHPEVNAGWILW